MPDSKQLKQYEQLEQLSPEKRYQYLLNQVANNKQIWILTDEHGCVMLNTEDEDCVPIWPCQALAERWATGDWSHCQSKAIRLSDWRQRWTQGLAQDELAIVICPIFSEDDNETGLVISPEEFDDDINSASSNMRS